MLILWVLIIAGLYCVRAGYRDAKDTANRVRDGHRQRVKNWAEGIEPAPSNAGQRAGIALAAFGTAAWLGLRAFAKGVREAWPDGMNAGAEWAQRRGWTRTAERAERSGRHRAPEPGNQAAPDDASPGGEDSKPIDPVEAWGTPCAKCGRKTRDGWRCNSCLYGDDERPSVVHDDHPYCLPPGCGPCCPQYRSWAWACDRCGAGGGLFATEEAAATAQKLHVCRQPEPVNTKERAPVAAETTVESLINDMTSEQVEATAAVDQATEAKTHAEDRTTAATTRVDQATASGFGDDVTGPLTTVADAQQAYKDACDAAALAAQAVTDATIQCLAALEKHRNVGEAADGLDGGRDAMADRDAYATA